jgi:DNA-binding CsgD family transcriptional regulator
MHQVAAQLTETAAPRAAEVTWLPTARPCAFEALDSLTPRELDILHRLALAASNTEIADALWLSVRTVEAHLATIYLKLNLRNRGRGECRVAAALTYLRACRMLDEPAFDAIRRSTTAGRLIRPA